MEHYDVFLADSSSILSEYYLDDKFGLPLCHPARLPLPQLDLIVLQEPGFHHQVDFAQQYYEHAKTELQPCELICEQDRSSSEKADQLKCKEINNHSSETNWNPSERRTNIVRIQSRQLYFQSDKPIEITLERLAEHFHESLE
eukprot:753478-Hanusia_phi.AAC.1